MRQKNRTSADVARPKIFPELVVSSQSAVSVEYREAFPQFGREAGLRKSYQKCLRPGVCCRVVLGGRVHGSLTERVANGVHEV
jgi:hypothetical protein